MSYFKFKSESGMEDCLGLKLHLFETFWLLEICRAFLTLSGPGNHQNLSVSWAWKSKKGSALFQEPESFKKVQFQAQDIFNCWLNLLFGVRLLIFVFSPPILKGIYFLWLICELDSFELLLSKERNNLNKLIIR